MLRGFLPSRDSVARRKNYETLVRPCFDALYRTALRMTGNSHAAEDLVQDTCLRAFIAFDRFRMGSNFKAWIFRILTNAFIDSQRKQARAPLVRLEEESHTHSATLYSAASSPRHDPEIHLLYRSFRSEAFQAMAALPADVRVVVALSLLEEFTYREIAEIVQCPVGTVRSRLSRGRRQLQIALRRYVPEEAAPACTNRRSSLEPDGPA